jgi:hypothetical protein
VSQWGFGSGVGPLRPDVSQWIVDQDPTLLQEIVGGGFYWSLNEPNYYAGSNYAYGYEVEEDGTMQFDAKGNGIPLEAIDILDDTKPVLGVYLTQPYGLYYASYLLGP